MTKTRERLDLIKMKLEILKIKADHYSWHSITPKSVQKQLEGLLVEIDKSLAVKLQMPYEALEDEQSAGGFKIRKVTEYDNT